MKELALAAACRDERGTAVRLAAGGTSHHNHLIKRRRDCFRHFDVSRPPAMFRLF